MDVLTFCRILEIAASIFVMHCMLMDCSTYYRELLKQLQKKQRTEIPPRIMADIDDALDGR